MDFEKLWPSPRAYDKRSRRRDRNSHLRASRYRVARVGGLEYEAMLARRIRPANEVELDGDLVARILLRKRDLLHALRPSR